MRQQQMNRVSYQIAFSLNQLQTFLQSRAFLKSQQALRKVFQDNKVDNTHGYCHAIKVMNHAASAIRALHPSDSMQSLLRPQPKQISAIQNATEVSKPIAKIIDIKYVKDIIFAALLHDADDRKYFPLNKNFQNAQKICLRYYRNPQFCQQKQNNYEISNANKDEIYTQSQIQSRVQFVKHVISKVSFSKNGDNIEYGQPEIFLYPRYADRIQAIGAKGIVRSFQYNMIKGQNIYLQSTKIPKNYQDLIKISQGRDVEYVKNEGRSDSFIDHIFDKLIHLKIPQEITNKYLRQSYQKGRQQIAVFVLKCAQSGYQNIQEQIQKLIKQINDN